VTSSSKHSSDERLSKDSSVAVGTSRCSGAETRSPPGDDSGKVDNTCADVVSAWPVGWSGSSGFPSRWPRQGLSRLLDREFGQLVPSMRIRGLLTLGRSRSQPQLGPDRTCESQMDGAPHPCLSRRCIHPWPKQTSRGRLGGSDDDAARQHRLLTLGIWARAWSRNSSLSCRVPSLVLPRLVTAGSS